MRYFPLGFDLRAGPCLLVGGDQHALAKCKLLCKGDAALTVIAPKIDPELKKLVHENQGSCVERAYQQGDCEQKILVVVADTEPTLAQKVSTDARALGVPVNVVDQPELSTVIFTGLVERPPLWFAISSDGSMPILARHWRHRLEAYIEPHWGAFASLLAKLKTRIRTQLGEPSKRARFLEKILSSQAQSMVAKGQHAEAETEINRMLEAEQDQSKVRGEVWLVGAGPGNPELLTLAAARLMEQADVVCYDRLVSSDILERVRRDAQRIAVGKSAGCRAISQDQINEILLREARAGKRVLRLKGGDPFVFARGGEELEYLARHKIPFRVIPGVSAANGCSCYAGIPLTDRRLAHSVRFLSGHSKDGALNLPWAELTDTEQTLVFYMGSQRLADLTKGLRAAGRDAQTPVALIERGTMEQQRILIADLSTMVNVALNAKISPPTLLIVGDVVRLHKTLHWYGSNKDALN